MQLRYFEAHGEVRQAISVIKTRTSRHERTIREFQITEAGLHVGEALTDFQGVLAGVPTYRGLIPLLGDVPSIALSGREE